MLKVRKHTQNVIVDLISLGCMLILMGTGFIMHYILPPKSHDKTVLDLTRHDWGDIHFWVALIFTGIIFYHLLLHLPWIKALFKKPTR